MQCIKVRKANRQLFTGIKLPTGSCQGTKQLVAITIFVCMLSEPQVSEVLQVATIYPSHTTSVTLILLSQVNIKQWEANLSGKLYHILLTSCKACIILDLCSRWTWTEPWWILVSHHPWLYNRCVLLVQKCHLTIITPSHHACIFTDNRIIISFLHVRMN